MTFHLKNCYGRRERKDIKINRRTEKHEDTEKDRQKDRKHSDIRVTQRKIDRRTDKHEDTETD